MKIIPILLLSLSTSILWADDFGDISIKDLQKAIAEKKVAIIDVNGGKSFKKAHIPGAIDFSSQSENLHQLLPENKNTLIVSYCGGPSCRAYLKGANAASSLGYKNIKHLSAGISGWKKAGALTESK